MGFDSTDDIKDLIGGMGEICRYLRMIAKHYVHGHGNFHEEDTYLKGLLELEKRIRNLEDANN